MIKRANFAKIYKDPNPPLMTLAEISCITNLIRKEESVIRTIVEIGCYLGGTTVRMAAAAHKDTQIYAIDNFTVDRSVVRDRAIENLARFKNITLLEMSSQQAAYQFVDPIDMIFIDGDHQDDSILKDCIFWLPKLRRGGFVIFDDYNNDEFPAIRRRVDEQMGSWINVVAIDTIVIFQKPY